MNSFFSKNTLSSDLITSRVLVAISFRDDGHRLRAFNFLNRYYYKNFPNFDIKSFDSPSKKFSLAQARNAGIGYAEKMGYDIVILSDADIFINKDILIRSVLEAFEEREIIIPFTRVSHFDENGTEMFLNGDKRCIDNIESVTEIGSHRYSDLMPCGGVIIGPPKLFKEAGMYDPNYYGWGHEDVDFHIHYAMKYNKLFKWFDSEGFAMYTPSTNRDTSINMDYFLKRTDSLMKILIRRKLIKKVD